MIAPEMPSETGTIWIRQSLLSQFRRHFRCSHADHRRPTIHGFRLSPQAIFTRPKSAGDLNKDRSKPNASAIPATRPWPNCSPPLFFSGSADRVYTGDCGVVPTPPCSGVPPLLGAQWTRCSRMRRWRRRSRSRKPWCRLPRPATLRGGLGGSSSRMRMGWLLGMWLTGPCLLCRFCATASRCVITVWCCIRTKRIPMCYRPSPAGNCDVRHIMK